MTRWLFICAHIMLGTIFLPLALIIALTQSPRAKSVLRPAVLFGITPIITNKYWAQALRKQGYKSISFVYGIYPINSPDDFDYTPEKLFPRLPRVKGIALCLPYLCFLWGLNAQVLNLFEIPKAGLAGKFDLVWCWGVIHHAADPEKAFKAVAGAAKPGGVVHCYVYSWPRSRRVRAMRAFLKPFRFSMRRQIITLWVKLGLYHGTVHEAFDALSPQINQEIPESEVQRWCRELRMRYERRYPRWAEASPDLFFNAWTP